MKRLAHLSIDADGDELVVRVRLATSLRSILASLLDLGAKSEAATIPLAPEVVEKVALDPAPPREPSLRDRAAKHRAGRDQAAQIARELDERIAAAYRDDGLSIHEVEKRFGVGGQRVRGALSRLGVPLRPKGRQPGSTFAGQRARKEAARALEPKAKPIVIPAGAERVAYQPPPPPSGKAKRGEAYKKTLARYFRKPALGLTPAQQQELVDKFFAGGGKVAVAPSAPAQGALKFGTGLGFTDGQKKRRA